MIKLKNDTKARSSLFVPDAMQHPAKGHIGMWQTIIEMYTKEGDWLLDPMAGIGTSLVAALMGRNVVCVELEQHFVEPMLASWRKMSQMPMLGHSMGEVMIVRGNATALPLGRADCVVSSPPYQDERQGGGLATREYQERSLADGTAAAGILGRKNTRIDNWQYTRPDVVVTSPPFSDTNIGRDGSLGEAPFGGPNSQARGVQYAPSNQTNVGNQKGQQYWDSMAKIYRECYRVLKPQGVMVLVLKGFVRDGKYQDLPLQTKELVESLGFKMFDMWKRELWSLSFWRILQKRNHPESWDDRLKFEEILAFRKDGLGTPSPEAKATEGGSVDDVIFSPPYENLSFSGDSPESQAKAEKHFGRKFGPAQNPSGYTRPVDAIISSPPYEGSVQGEPGIDWTKTDSGKRDMSIEPGFKARVARHSGYTKARGA